MNRILSACSRRIAARPLAVRAFGSGPIDPIYRRPLVPEVNEPFTEDNELTWRDASAPEPALDDLEDDNIASGRSALVSLGVALGLLAGVYQFAKYIVHDVQEDTVSLRHYEHLKTELGGHGRAIYVDPATNASSDEE